MALPTADGLDFNPSMQPTINYLPKLVALYTISRPLPPLHFELIRLLPAADVVVPVLEQGCFLLDQKGLLQMDAHHLT